jgi:hypothetical protein
MISLADATDYVQFAATGKIVSAGWSSPRLDRTSVRSAGKRSRNRDSSPRDSRGQLVATVFQVDNASMSLPPRLRRRMQNQWAHDHRITGSHDARLWRRGCNCSNNLILGQDAELMRSWDDAQTTSGLVRIVHVDPYCHHLVQHRGWRLDAVNTFSLSTISIQLQYRLIGPHFRNRCKFIFEVANPSAAYDLVIDVHLVPNGVDFISAWNRRADLDAICQESLASANGGQD